jgi:effector-binding domain-containing protein
MLTLPQVFDREEQSYAFITFTVRMNELQKPAEKGFPLLFQTLEQQGITPIGAPFYNYRRINMAETLDVEAGIPVSRQGQEAGAVRFGTLPAGRFVGLTWHGHPDKLEPVTGLLIGWTHQTQTPLDMEELSDGDHFACRLEIYETDPGDEPDMEKWVTHLAFKLKD